MVGYKGAGVNDTYVSLGRCDVMRCADGYRLDTCVWACMGRVRCAWVRACVRVCTYACMWDACMRERVYWKYGREDRERVVGRGA